MTGPLSSARNRGVARPETSKGVGPNRHALRRLRACHPIHTFFNAVLRRAAGNKLPATEIASRLLGVWGWRTCARAPSEYRNTHLDLALRRLARAHRLMRTSHLSGEKRFAFSRFFLVSYHLPLALRFALTRHLRPPPARPKRQRNRRSLLSILPHPHHAQTRPWKLAPRAPCESRRHVRRQFHARPRMLIVNRHSSFRTSRHYQAAA